MIRKITLFNFQAHEKLEVELDPLVTTITGDSGSGKSGLVRAFRWICLNKVGGKKTIHDGKEFVKVILSLVDHKITRRKSKSNNTYYIDKKKLAAFRKSIPDEISSIINTDEINFQMQLDNPFWFSLTPGQVSKEINKIVNLESIDRILSSITSKVRKAKSVLEVSEDRLKSLKSDRKKLHWVTDFIKVVDSISQDEANIARKHATIDSAGYYLLKAVELRKSQIVRNSAKLELQNALSLYEQVIPINAILEKAEKSVREYQKYSRIVKKRIDTKELDGFVSELESLKDIPNIEEYERMEEEICQLNNLSGRIASKIEKITKGKCPICQSPLKT